MTNSYKNLQRETITLPFEDTTALLPEYRTDAVQGKIKDVASFTNS